MHRIRLLPLAGTTLAALALLAACGGGGNDGPAPPPATAQGTLRLSLTDAPSCGYDTAFVTVEKVRVHRSSSAGDDDAGWSEVVLAVPLRVDLLSLNNGTLLPLGQTELPAGSYTLMRLVLAANTATHPLANAVTPSGGVETALTTPSGQQSGLKMNVSLDVPAGEVAEFAIDFDACKSFVRAGNSGKILLKPVLSVVPILSAAGQRIVGFVDPALAQTGTTVSVQLAGAPVRATPPDATGRFVLYPVPAGSYDLVITAAGRVNAVMTGVPVSATGSTVIGSDAARIDTPVSLASHVASGTVSVGGSTVDTGAAVRAMQTLSGGPTIEVGYSAADALTGGYGIRMPAGAPARLAYAAGATSFTFGSIEPAAALYRLEASAPGYTVKPADISLTADVTTPFDFQP
jgi:hypothetical protein